MCVVEAEGDVPHAVGDVIGELAPAAGALRRDPLPRRGGAEDRRACGAALLQAKQTAMLRVDVEEQPVGDVERARGGGADCFETQHRVRAIAVFVDEMPDRMEGARPPVALDAQSSTPDRQH
jgi:hypothetical protein